MWSPTGHFPLMTLLTCKRTPCRVSRSQLWLWNIVRITQRASWVIIAVKPDPLAELWKSLWQPSRHAITPHPMVNTMSSDVLCPDSGSIPESGPSLKQHIEPLMCNYELKSQSHTTSHSKRHTKWPACNKGRWCLCILIHNITSGLSVIHPWCIRQDTAASFCPSRSRTLNILHQQAGTFQQTAEWRS